MFVIVKDADGLYITSICIFNNNKHPHVFTMVCACMHVVNQTILKTIFLWYITDGEFYIATNYKYICVYTW